MSEAPTLSQAEIADRITILELKHRHCLIDARREVDYLMSHCTVPLDMLNRLRIANENGWESMQAMVDHFEGRKVICDADLLNMIRVAYERNKARVAVKNEISAFINERQEAKSWKW